MRAVALAAAVAACWRAALAFRIVDESEVGTDAFFEPYAHGFVDSADNPALVRERNVNPGAPQLATQPQRFDKVHERRAWRQGGVIRPVSPRCRPFTAQRCALAWFWPKGAPTAPPRPTGTATGASAPACATRGTPASPARPASRRITATDRAASSSVRSRAPRPPPGARRSPSVCCCTMPPAPRRRAVPEQLLGAGPVPVLDGLLRLQRRPRGRGLLPGWAARRRRGGVRCAGPWADAGPLAQTCAAPCTRCATGAPRRAACGASSATL